MKARVSKHRYVDPLDQLWLATAARLGFRVERGDSVYASTNGRGVMTLGTHETLDQDDCLAQMIFHECCHWLVEGEETRRAPDWGLDNVTDRDVPREMACLRLQAFLADRHGLRAVLAPTTDFREFHDALPADPFEPRHWLGALAGLVILLAATRGRDGALNPLLLMIALVGGLKAWNARRALAPVRLVDRLAAAGRRPDESSVESRHRMAALVMYLGLCGALSLLGAWVENGQPTP